MKIKIRSKRIRKLRKKVNISKHYRIVVILLVLMFIGFIGSNSFVRADYNPEFSDELQYEPFDTVEQLTNYYDGIDTFYHDSIGVAASYWITTGSTQVVASESSHTNVHEVGGSETAKMYFANANYTFDKELGLSLWFKKEWDFTLTYSYFRITLNTTNTIEFRKYQHSQPEFDRTDWHTRINGGSWNLVKQVFYWDEAFERFNIEIYNDTTDIKVRLYINDVLESDYTWFSIDDFFIDTLEVWSDSSETYTDAVNLYYSDNSQVGSYRSQLRNEIPTSETNKIPMTSDDYVSMYSTLVDTHPHNDNNYRNELITDNVITDRYVDNSRVLRMEGTGSDDNKYKVNQFYFTGLNETYNEYSETILTEDLTIDNLTSLEVFDGLYYNDSIVNSSSYEAMFSFTNDLIGDEPQHFHTGLGGTASIDVINYLDGHRKVLELDSQVSDCFAALEFHESGQQLTTGTIEFYFQVSDATETLKFRILDSNGQNIVSHMKVQSEFLQYHDGISFNNIIGISDNTWYKLRIDFSGISRTFDLYLDGVKEITGGTLYGFGFNIDEVWFEASGNGVKAYLDAIGIKGQYGGTPKDFMTHNYFGSYSFNDTLNFNVPNNWIDTSTGASLTEVRPRYTDSYEGNPDSYRTHEKVLRLYDDASGRAIIEKNIENHGTYDTTSIEFWLSTSNVVDVTEIIVFTIYDTDDTYLTKIFVEDGILWCWDAFDDSAEAIYLMTANWWEQIRLDIDFTDDSWEFFMSGFSIETGEIFSETTRAIGKIKIETFTDSNNYIDDIGISGFSNYTTGANLNPEMRTYELGYHNFTRVNFTAFSNVLSVDINTTIEIAYTYDSNMTYQHLNSSIFNYSSNSWVQLDNSTCIYSNNITYSIENNTHFLSPTNQIKMLFTAINESSLFLINVSDFNVYTSRDYFYSPKNQTLQIRVDTLDSSDNLINILYWNIDFNNTDGLITWNVLYRESLAVPRWYAYPTNPIFHFEDYLNGETLENLQINTHFFITWYDNQNWLYIRTQVCFNDIYNQIYEYDKIISLGNNSFYDTQEGLKVRYIDYFNDNHFHPYTHSNLKGFRTLQLNSSLMKYNFLDCGFYKSDLEYYEPPPEPQPPAPPPTYDRPAGADYYHEYTGFQFTTSLSLVQIENFTYNFTNMHFSPYTAKYWFDYDAIAYWDADDWGNWGFWGEWNWARNAICFICNLGIGILNLLNLAIQYILFGFALFFNYVVLYLVLGLFCCELLWNIGFYYLLYGIVWIIISIFVLLQWLFYEGLEIVVLTLAGIFAWLLTVFLWLLTLCTADFNTLLDVVSTSVLEMSEFLLTLFFELATNMITFVLFIAIYTEITLLILFKYYVSKAKGNTNRALALQQAYETFLSPLRALWNVILAIKSMITGWL